MLNKKIPIYLIVIVIQVLSKCYCFAPVRHCNAKDNHTFINCLSNSSFTSITLSPDENYVLNTRLTRTNESLEIYGCNATIRCAGNVSMEFRHLDLTLDSITILECGGLHDSTGSYVQNGQILKFTTALYILNSSNVNIQNVTIRRSNGVGLSLINCTGNVTVVDSTFEHNFKVGIGDRTGGGGLYIELFSYQSDHMMSYDISRCHFINNTASSNTSSIGNNNDKHFFYGLGGGLAMNLQVNDTGLQAKIQDCVFLKNTAQRGGGLFIHILEESYDISIKIVNSIFNSNECITQTIPHSLYSAGGGIGFLHLTNASNNSCLVQNCYFVNNTAFYGGGISMGTKKTPKCESNFSLIDSHFENNTARIGSALDLFCYFFEDPAIKCIVEMLIKDTTFINNTGVYIYQGGIKSRTSSTIQLDKLETSFEGNILIQNNSASGISIENTVMKIKANAVVTIEQNSGRIGGGISLIGISLIQLKENANLEIIGNIATERGGGIYAKFDGETFSVYSHTCFVKFAHHDGNSGSEHRDISPDEWTANITFSRNSANGRPNDIFVSSIYPCVWPLFENDIKKNIQSTFCGWKTWHFDTESTESNCTDLIRTLPKQFSQNQYNVSVFPMKRKQIKCFKVVDDLENDVTNDTIFTSCQSQDGHPGPDIRNDGILVNQKKSTHQLLVQTAYDRTISTTVNLTILECPAGYVYDTISGCKCSFQPNIFSRCNISTLSVDVFIGHCIGYDTNKNGVMTSKCPYQINNLNYLTTHLSTKSASRDELNSEFCSPFNREGFLCQRCIPGYGIDIFSPTYDCVDCMKKRDYVHWIKAVAVITLPQIVFFLFVIVFHIGITAPSMNGYVLFSHFITVPLEVLILQSALKLDPHLKTHYKELTDVLLDPYRIWSFDYPEIFRANICLHESVKIMHAIAIRYIHAFFPIALIMIALLLIELHARNCKPVVHLWKPLCYLCIRFRRKWEIKTSVIDAFATVILLSYSKIVTTSFFLLARNEVRDLQYKSSETRLDFDTSVIYFKGQHCIFGAIAIVILCTFGALPPLLLILYPYRWFNKFLAVFKLNRWHGLHIFVETLNGCFKDGTNGSPERRYFAGIYFIFRMVIFAMFTFINEIARLTYTLALTFIIFLVILVIFRPYKKNFYTYLDTIFLGILAVANCSTLYCLMQLQSTGQLPIRVWHFTYFIISIPTIYLVIYIFYLLCSRSRSKFIQRYCISNVKRLQNGLFFANTRRSFHNLVDDESYSVLGNNRYPTRSYLGTFSDVPDRVDNPQRYCNLERSNQMEGASYSKLYMKRDKDSKEMIPSLESVEIPKGRKAKTT